MQSQSGMRAHFYVRGVCKPGVASLPSISLYFYLRLLQFIYLSLTLYMIRKSTMLTRYIKANILVIIPLILIFNFFFGSEKLEIIYMLVFVPGEHMSKFWWCPTVDCYMAHRPMGSTGISFKY